MPTYAQVRRDFTATLYTIAHTMDIQIRQGAGAAMLQLPPHQDWPSLDEFDLTPLGFEAALEVVYRYAFFAEVGDTKIDDDWEEGNLGRLEVIAEMVSASHFIARNEDDVWEMFGDDRDGEGSFRQMVRLALARFRVDHSREVSLNDLMVLSGMEERSVRNALKSQGIAITEREVLGSHVNKQQILEWLRLRQGFVPTRRIGSLGNIPERLEPHEIPAFIKQRAKECLKLRKMSHQVPALENSEKTLDREIALGNLGKTVGWTNDQMEALLSIDSVEDISPDDCPAIARMLELDKLWWTDQVLRARFPEAMKERAPVMPQTEMGPSLLDEKTNTLDVVLTEAGIRNGYFDIERRDAHRFFPADSFGTKDTQKLGEEVLLHHDQKKSPYCTDIRIKSRALASPRKRFTAYFNAHEAKEGDIIRIQRLSEREYRLTFQPR